MIVVDNYIVAVEAKDSNFEEIMARISEKPKDPDGYTHKLRADTLEWELVENPPDPEPTVDDEVDDAEALSILLGGAE